ncbi:DUF305 domain-containing protein [Nocardioides aestuarii]|uniref:DUF305 domain-containing protein n=1 Tax=Nocardioides aestuarii TaxID=252231 RepID=A0ABW4TIY4_9ACTN
MNTTRRVAAVLAAAALTLSACGDDTDEAASSIPESQPFNQADVDFATDMIIHHSQALTMVDLAAPRPGLSPKLMALLEEIRNAQTQEAELMTDWLEDWGQPVPNNPRSHGGMDHDEAEDMASDMPGMMSDDEMGMLEDADGDAFEEMWLEMMVEHHEGAIEMAEAEADDGEFHDTVELAEQIATTQAAEVEQMEKLLD